MSGGPQDPAAASVRPVAKSLRDIVQVELNRDRILADGHDQTHSSDSSGTSHHYSTPKAFESAAELQRTLEGARIQALTRSQTIQGGKTMPISVKWSVERDGDHSQTHSETADANDLPVESVIANLRAAVEKSLANTGAVDQGEDPFSQLSPQPGARQSAVRAGQDSGVSGEPALAGGQSVSEKVSGRLSEMHDQTHSEGGHGGGSIEQAVEQVGQPQGLTSRSFARAAVRQTVGSLAGEMHDQTHSEGHAGDTIDELANRASASPAAKLAAEMHDQTHSEGHGGGSVEQVAEQAGQPQGLTSRSFSRTGVRQSAGSLAGEMHDQTHSEGGGGGSINELASRASVGSVAKLAGEMHDQTHSEGHGGSIEQVAQQAGQPQGLSSRSFARVGVRQSVSSLAGEMHDQTHSEGGGGGGSINELVSRASANRAAKLASEMHDQTHSEGHGGGSVEQVAQQSGQPQALTTRSVRRSGVRQSAGSLANEMHDQTHSEGGGINELVNRTSLRSADKLADEMHDQNHSESGHGGGSIEQAARQAGQPQGLTSRSAGRTGLRQSGANLAGELHDQTHSESGHGGQEFADGRRVAQTFRPAIERDLSGKS